MKPMRIFIRRRITLEEILERIEKLRSMYGNIETVYKQALSSDTRLLEIYLEWKALRDALKEYEEDGETLYTIEQEVKPETARRLFTKNMLKLLGEVRSSESISALASKVGRSVANVYRDLKFLESIRVVVLRREGKRLRPELLMRELVLQL